MVHWFFVLYLICGGVIAGIMGFDNWPERKLTTVAAVIVFIVAGPVFYVVGGAHYLIKHFPHFVRWKAWRELFRGEWSNLPPDRIASFRKAAPFYLAEKNLSVKLWVRVVARLNRIKL